jgi:hypothetical protein
MTARRATVPGNANPDFMQTPQNAALPMQRDSIEM